MTRRLGGRGINTTVIKLLASAGVLGGALAFAGTSYAGPATGLYRIAPQVAPHKSFDLPGDGCPYNAGNVPSSLSLYSHVNTCATGDQRWWVQDMGGSQFEIRQGGSGGKCLDIDGGGTGTRLGTYTCTGGTNQRWFMDLMQSGELYGTWRIKSVRDGRVIDLSNGNTGNGTVIQMWSDAGVAAQRWILWGNGGMHKDFEDDMNGSSVDTGVWNKANFGAGRFNGELQAYTQSTNNVTEFSGHMTLFAHNNNGCTGMNCYTSGRVSSKGKRWYRNGMFSARIHYYESGGGNMGTWPAFWLLGNNINEDPVTAATIGGNCWPTSGARELDVWEWTRNNNGASYVNNGITDSGGCNAAVHHATNTSSWNWGDWIVAAVQFDAGRVKFYRGGVKTHDIPDSGLANEDFAFVFNVAVGGTLGGSTADFNSTGKWASIDVDWAAHETY
jgi:Ricin-type beta-trefoil lectin domain-like